MIRLYSVLMVLALALIATGCATMEQAFPEIGAAQPENFDKTRTYSASHDDIWSALVAVLTEMEFSFDLVEKESGLITTDWASTGPYSTKTGWGKTLEVTLNPLISCNVKDSVDIPSDTRCKLDILVGEAAAGTTVTVNSDFQALKKRAMQAPHWEPCNSTGELEKQLLDAVGERTGR